MKRSPIRRQSKKRQREQRERVKMLREIEADQEICQRCRQAGANQAHEYLRRSQGGSITEIEGIALICFECHRFITEHPRQAVAEGWAVTRRGY